MKKTGMNNIAVMVVSILVLCLSCTVWANEGSGLGKREKVVLHKANKAMQNQDLQKARKIVRCFLKESSGEVSGRLYIFLGYTWYQEENSARAREVYKRGLEHAPENKELHRNFAVACYQTGKFEPAGKHFEQAYQLSKPQDQGPDYEFLYRAGTAFYQCQDYSRAKGVLQRLVSEAENVESDWLKLLTRIHFNLKEWKEAEQIVNMLLDKDPLNRDYWKMLSQCNIRQNDHAAAATNLEIAYCIREPDDPSGWEQLSNLYMYLNTPVEAAKCLQKSFSGDVSAQKHEKLADIYYKALRLDKALKYMDKALDKEETADRYLKMGNYLYENRQFARAIDAFGESAKLNPANGRAYLLKGFAACEIDKWELAKRSFKKAGEFEDCSSSAQSGLAFVTDILKAKRATNDKAIVAKVHGQR